MGSKIENLGDYNTARIMVQQKGGDLSAVVKEIQMKVAPKHIGIGILVGAPLGVLATLAVTVISADYKARKKKRNKELEKRLKDALITEGVIEDDALEVSDEPAEQEEPPCS